MSKFDSHRSKITTMHRAGHITDKSRDRALARIDAAEQAEMAAQAPAEPADGVSAAAGGNMAPAPETAPTGPAAPPSGGPQMAQGETGLDGKPPKKFRDAA